MDSSLTKTAQSGDPGISVQATHCCLGWTVLVVTADGLASFTAPDLLSHACTYDVSIIAVGKGPRVKSMSPSFQYSPGCQGCRTRTTQFEKEEDAAVAADMMMPSLWGCWCMAACSAAASVYLLTAPPRCVLQVCPANHSCHLFKSSLQVGCHLIPF